MKLIKILVDSDLIEEYFLNRSNEVHRQFKDEMQQYLMKQRILRKEYDSQVIF
ncbi:hypothetical protein [Pseudanabaena sp. 'Roaring Creek']|uniref:hypothetical protein n=1 Tax=Pseudanabaena sp. 'Roaring Creek' TaxID=1681830 RepID=UPI000A4CDF42|nr:hypothetical protein [Pseudanabaena sp. 'Roaring Creek']